MIIWFCFTLWVCGATGIEMCSVHLSQSSVPPSNLSDRTLENKDVRKTPPHFPIFHENSASVMSLTEVKTAVNNSELGLWASSVSPYVDFLRGITAQLCGTRLWRVCWWRRRRCWKSCSSFTLELKLTLTWAKMTVKLPSVGNLPCFSGLQQQIFICDFFF